jgi:hypothetical protein
MYTFVGSVPKLQAMKVGRRRWDKSVCINDTSKTGIHELFKIVQQE